MKQSDKDRVRDAIFAAFPKLQQRLDTLLDVNVKANMREAPGIVIDRAWVELVKKRDPGKGENIVLAGTTARDGAPINGGVWQQQQQQSDGWSRVVLNDEVMSE
ncbi:MAG: hypothetical protein M1816_004530 [Peltula sp. TS41687]|nr:MAG: hypothetical protein M1816_004530 [Peltula sp. TS41687]